MQEELNLKGEQKKESVEEYQFELPKGKQMLYWRGKRPFSTTQFYPAQLKETYGEEVDGWMNKIFWGDNLQVMSHLLKNYRGQVDLIYIDPPFDSKADYKKKIDLRGKNVENDKTGFEEKQYTDIWSNDEYLQFMFERLILMRELLSDRGSIYLHCDWHKVHLLRLIMDEIFGDGNFVNEIIWCYTGPGYWKDKFVRKHDNLLFYSKSKCYTFNPQFVDYKSGIHVNKNGIVTTYGGGTKESNSEELENRGKPIEDYWTDIYTVDRVRSEMLDYPTQKPNALIERIIQASSNPGDLIFDCFMGSGTTQNVAMKLGRRFIGADINLGSIDTTVKRLCKTAEKIEETVTTKERLFTGFEVYNVNNYDVFRNPIQAKELLVEALELQVLPGNDLYDGEKDGRMVKIMPINRIATRADLNELITGFPRETFEKRKAEAPNKPVEHITLVCMGHEPDLAANLQLQLKEEGYNIDVEVVDILRDKMNLELRRDSEADVQIEGDRIVIREFFPMNLLQKLSLEKTNVGEWRELVDSVKIDFNYDGSVFSPTVIDTPEGRDMVKGSYKIPVGAGTIKVKITDLLSETCEVTIKL